MRKYFNPKSNKKLLDSSTVSGVNPWLMLLAYVRANDVHLLPLDKLNLEIAILREDPVMLKVQVSDLERTSLLHGHYQKSSKRFRVIRQIICLLKKYPFIGAGIDPKQAAICKWQAAEDQCGLTNERLRNADFHPSWVSRAQDLISQVLGSHVTRSNLKQIMRDGRHGPGSTLDSNGQRTTPYYKFMDFPYSCSKSAYKYAIAAIACDSGWFDLIKSSGLQSTIPHPSASDYQKFLSSVVPCIDVCDSDRITFVPKDTFTERPIAVSGSLNLYLQLGVMNFITSRLKRFGVDLTTQDRNREMAYYGSALHEIDGFFNPSQFSTIDLASASDTISIELVRLLLPPEWFALLDDLRYKSGEHDGQLVTYNKFSAMGNGFTFPLESLVFWAVAKASAETFSTHTLKQDEISVFGDDIIVRYKYAHSVIEALEYSGFTVNTEKSFIQGPFKESCGADYFRGDNVRPIYLKRPLDGYRELFSFANRIAKQSLHYPNPGLTAMYSYLISFVTGTKRNLVSMTGSDESGLQVPLAYAKAHVPLYMARDELEVNGVDNYDPTYPIEKVRTLRAKPYKGYAAARLYLALRNAKTEPDVSSIFYYQDDARLALLEANASGIVTRRNAVIEKIELRLVPNWDIPDTNLSCHPIWFC